MIINVGDPHQWTYLKILKKKPLFDFTKKNFSFFKKFYYAHNHIGDWKVPMLCVNFYCTKEEWWQQVVVTYKSIGRYQTSTLKVQPIILYCDSYIHNVFSFFSIGHAIFFCALYHVSSFHFQSSHSSFFQSSLFLCSRKLVFKVFFYKFLNRCFAFLHFTKFSCLKLVLVFF